MRTIVLGLAAWLVVLGGCADDSVDGAAPAAGSSSTTVATTTTSTGSTTSTEPPDQPAEPLRSAVDLEGVTVEPVSTPGGGVPQSGAADSLAPGYVETELFVSGTARTFSGPATGPAEVATTGNSYVTRVLVRMPADAADFSGRVVVEPFNTSGGADAGAVWGFLGSMIQAQGDAWIGVSERWVSMTSLQSFDAARYESVSIPSNGLAWDILGHVGALVRDGDDGGLLGDLEAEVVYMAGYSQNGIDTATFASSFGTGFRMTDGSPVYAGYLPLAHAGSLTPLDSGETAIPAFEIVPIGATDVPVVDLESESDVLGFSHPAYTSPGHAYVRRDDSDGPTTGTGCTRSRAAPT